MHKRLCIKANNYVRQNFYIAPATIQLIKKPIFISIMGNYAFNLPSLEYFVQTTIKSHKMAL